MQDQKNKAAAPFKVILAFAVVYIVWGSTYFFIQKAIQGFPPFLLGAIRFLIAGMLMIGWSWLRGEKLFVINDIKHAAIGGFLMLFVGTGAVIWVEQYMPSAMVAIMVSSGPLWFILLDRPKWSQNFSSKATIGGLVIGFIGVILLFSENIVGAFSSGSDFRHLAGLAILIVGSMAWAGGSLYSQYKSPTVSVSVNTSWQMLAAGFAFLPGSIFRGEFATIQWQQISADAWISLAYLILLGSIAGFSAYVWLLKVRPATQVSTHAYVNPVVAVLLGVFFAGENISFLQIGGLVVILGSVLLINRVKKSQKYKGKEESHIHPGESVVIKKPVKKNKKVQVINVVKPVND